MHEHTANNDQAAIPLLIALKKAVSALVLFFCFLLFPAFLIFSSLNHLFELKTNNLRMQKLEQMRNQLEHLEKYSDNSRYLHFLCKTIFDKAQTSADPVSFLRKNITNLKTLYNGHIEFIVWDNKGQPIKELTDQQGYRYILSKLYEMLKDVADVLKADDQANILQIKSVGRNLNLARQYLGKIFLPDNLRQPYLKNAEAGPILSDFTNKYSSFWYQIGDRVSLFCFLSEGLIKGNHGLYKIVNTLNHQSADLICGFTLSPDVTTPVTTVPEALSGFLARTLAEFENIAEPLFENDQALILISLAQPGVRSFCIHQKQPEVWSAANNRDTVFIRIMAFILLFYFLLYGFVTFRQEFVSIKWKLTGLFLFANLAPLAIMGFIAHDYLNSKFEALRNEANSDLSKLMRDFDSRFASIQDDISGKLNLALDKINTLSQNRALQSDEVARIESLAKEFSPSEAYLISSASEQLMQFRPDAHKWQKMDFIQPLCAAVVKFCNGTILPRVKEDMFSPLLSPESSDFVRRSFSDSKKIVAINMGTMQKLSYWYIFGNANTYANNYFLILLWEKTQLQEHYVDKYFKSVSQNSANAAIFVRTISGTKCWPEINKFPAGLTDQMQRTGGFRGSLSGKITFQNTPHIFVSHKGRNLDKILMAAVFPESQIESRIARIRGLIIFSAFVSLFLTLIICHALSGQFLTPINNLRQATMAIGSHDFSHRIPIADEDEFGHLNIVFNRVIEGLGELEVARIVQDSLFPGNSFKAGPYAIYGKSVVMTTLGGDYYDCLQIDDKTWGIVIGDVAGHGVPAGLMMAMAKAAVLMASNEEKQDAAKLTTRLHQVFFAIKNDKLKRMMTLQYFVVKPEEYSFSFANAGHCFPVLIKHAQQTAEFIEHVATPLGIGARARYKNYDFKVMPGEALVLYTDGIAEAKNSRGEEFGFERVKSILLELYDPDPEVYYRRVFNVYENWSPKPDDDLTLIMITNNQ